MDLELHIDFLYWKKKDLFKIKVLSNLLAFALAGLLVEMISDDNQRKF